MIRPGLLVSVSALALMAGPVLAASLSSGGYSRPSFSAPSRPSTPSPSYSSPSSGGYSHPSTASVPPSVPKSSAGDRAVSQSVSGDALRSYRNGSSNDDDAQKRKGPADFPSGVSPPQSYSDPAPSPAPAPSTTVVIHHDHLWSGGWGWGSPPPVYVPVPVQPAQDVYAAPVSAYPDSAPIGGVVEHRHGHRWIWWVLGIGIVGGLGYVGWRYMQTSGWKPQSKGGFVSNYAAIKTEVAPSKPSRYRPGMVIDIEAAPLILGAGQIQVPSSIAGTVTVERVETVRIGGQSFVRLRFASDFVQVHEDTAGEIDNARLFVPYDTITPADSDEWGFWLDKADGVIGLGLFEDKGGRLYARMWSPSNDGKNRVEPREIWGDYSRGVAMLYGRNTDLPDPAPQTDLLLIETDEARGSASVNLYAGVDLDPASLSIA